jgi:hypothetical protein
MDKLLTPEQRIANRLAFDSLTDRLRKQTDIIGLIKKEILSIRERFANMCAYLSSVEDDEMTQIYRDLYDAHITAFLHSVSLYLTTADASGIRYIQNVTDEIKTTDISVDIRFPHRNVSQHIATIDNITIDFQNIDIYIGATELNCLSAEQIASQFSVIVETPKAYFSKVEFLMGIGYELEKLEVFHSQVILNEQKILSAIRYVADLKTFGLY